MVVIYELTLFGFVSTHRDRVGGGGVGGPAAASASLPGRDMGKLPA